MNSTSISIRKKRLVEQIVSACSYMSVLRGVSWVMIIRITGAVLTYLSHVMLARWLGAYEFGVFAYAWVWVATLGFIAPLGMSGAAVKFLPDYLARNKWHRVEGLIKCSSVIVLFSGMMLGGLCALALFLMRDRVTDYYLIPLYIAAACIPLIGLIDLYQEVARGFRWIKLAFSPSYVLKPASLMILVGCIVYSGTVATANTAMLMAFFACLVTLIIQLVILRRSLGAAMPQTRPIYHIRFWLQNAFPFLIIEAFYLVLENTDIIMLGHFMQPDDVATYYATVRTSGLIGFIAFAVSALAAPQFSSLHGQKKYQELRNFYVSTVHMTFWPSLAVGIGLFILGESILSFFGAHFVEGYTVLVILVAGILFEAAFGPISFLLNMTGHQTACARAIGVIALLNIILNALLIPQWGLTGAASATASSIVLRTLWFAVLSKRYLQISALDVFKIAPVNQAEALPSSARIHGMSGREKVMQIPKEKAANFYLVSYVEGLQAYAQKNYAHAQQAFEEVLKLNNGYVQARYYLSGALMMQGQLSQAEENIVEFLRSHPKSLKGLILLASVRYRLQNYDGTKEVLSALLKEHPKDVKTLKLMGNLQLIIGNEASDL